MNALIFVVVTTIYGSAPADKPKPPPSKCDAIIFDSLPIMKCQRSKE
jgi:hypothetical protein